MADYLEAFAAHHDLPMRDEVRVMALTKSGDTFVITTADGELTASNVVVATGSYGADIRLEVVASHPTWPAGPKVAHIPPDLDTWFTRTVVVRVVRFVQRNVLCLRTPMGRRRRRTGAPATGTTSHGSNSARPSATTARPCAHAACPPG